MRGRRVVPAVLMSICMVMCSCGSQIPEMTLEQSEMVAEYAAFSLLKYDANNRSRLIDADYDHIVEEYEDRKMGYEPLPPAENTEEVVGADDNSSSTTTVIFTPAPSGEENTGAVEIVDMTGGQPGVQGERVVRSDLFFVELPEGCDLNYTSFEVVDQYVGDQAIAGFGLSASEGKKLLVLHFELSNTSGEDQLVDIWNQNLTFKCTVNDKVSRYSLISMLTEDLSTYKDLVGDGEVIETVLLFEIAEEMLDSVTSLDLSLKNAPKTDTIHLL